ADGLKLVSLAGSIAPAGLEVGGEQVKYFVDPNEPYVLIAYTGNNPDNTTSHVFKLTLLPSSDEYEFTLYKSLDGGFTPVDLNDHIGNNGGNDTWLGYTQLAGDGDILFSGFTHNGSFGAL